MRIEAPSKGVTVSKGLGTRHAAAAAISKHTKAIAVAVSQAGTVRLFQNGEMVLHIEPFDRPLTFGPVTLDRVCIGGGRAGGARPLAPRGAEARAAE
jgi:hypothetical protein